MLIGSHRPPPRHQSWEGAGTSTASGGDSAIREIADRLEGKVPQAQIIQGDEDGGSVRYYAEMPVKDKTTEEWTRAMRRTGGSGTRVGSSGLIKPRVSEALRSIPDQCSGSPYSRKDVCSTGTTREAMR
jgi:hypothetical protein